MQRAPAYNRRQLQHDELQGRYNRHDTWQFGGNGIAYFGLGRAEPFCDFFCEPLTDPSIYVRILPSDFFGLKVEITSSTCGTLATTLGQGGTGTHRVRIAWNSSTRAITLSIMSNYVADAEFVPTAVMGPFTLGSSGTSQDINCSCAPGTSARRCT
jgi:hypothetical protein